jgi:hypothetical protein
LLHQDAPDQGRVLLDLSNIDKVLRIRLSM